MCTMNGITPPSGVSRNDVVAVDMLVQDWNLRGDKSPIRYYKRLNDSNSDTSEHSGSLFNSNDFILVYQTEAQAQMMVDNPRSLCTDGTHGCTGYGYHLLTIMVIDKYGQGLCVGWAIVSRENVYTWELFCKSLRPECHKLKPKVGMADLALSQWNGLRAVFPSLKYHLWCWWHIDQKVQLHCHGRQSKVQVMYQLAQLGYTFGMYISNVHSYVHLKCMS